MRGGSGGKRRFCRSLPRESLPVPSGISGPAIAGAAGELSWTPCRARAHDQFHTARRAAEQIPFVRLNGPRSRQMVRGLPLRVRDNQVGKRRVRPCRLPERSPRPRSSCKSTSPLTVAPSPCHHRQASAVWLPSVCTRAFQPPVTTSSVSSTFSRGKPQWQRVCCTLPNRALL